VPLESGITSFMRLTILALVVASSLAAEASEVLTLLAFYAGWPNVFSALPVVKAVFEARHLHSGAYEIAESAALRQVPAVPGTAPMVPAS
jgi:hypothetical protein